jgi:multidrug efflux pump subunit AcrA (membrane-fusion protein)
MSSATRLIRAGFLFAWIAAFTWGCDKPPAVDKTPRPIRAIRVGDAPTLTGRSFPGTAEAVDAVDMSFRVGGPLVAFPANQLGQKVAKGDLLAQIDSRDFEVRLRDTRASLARAGAELEAMRKARPEDIEKLKAELDRATAAAQFARAEYNRNLALKESRAVSLTDIELAQARAALADAEVIQARESLRIGEQGARPEEIKAKEAQIVSLQAAVQTAQDELSDTKLVAPFDGTVSATYVENFEVVQAKQRVVRIVNASEYEIRVDIPENLIALMPRVTEAVVTIEAFPDVEIPARVAEVGTEASPRTRTYPVKLRFSPPEGLRIRPGMTGSVRGRREPSADDLPGHVLPSTAILPRDGKNSVWIYDSASRKVHAREVQVMGATPYGVRVTGVEPNEWVVTAGTHYLREDQEVRLPDEPSRSEGA